MELTYAVMRVKLQTYFKENFGAIAVVCFLFVTGLVSGVRLMQSLYQEQAAGIISVLPDILRADGIPWLQCLLLNICTHALIACMLLFSGMWLPAAILWGVAVLLRGVLSGVAMGACMAGWPDHTAIVLLLMLQLETAFLLPPFIRLGVLAQKQFSGNLKKKLGAPIQPPSFFEYTALYLKACAGLFPAILLQSVMTPAILALFC